ncbi:MAG: DUF1269 domain-containing protein [Acidimicrobiia bacterium]|nr:DUF1269 domain-containing protein [Acidimicrobiia bacterium]
MGTIQEIGPVDYVVIEFPKGEQNFTGAVARELVSLVEAELIRVLDVLVLAKDEDGEIEAFELEDLEGVGELGALEAQLAEVLAAEDVKHLAAAMEPGSVAGVVVWENSWAAPFAVAARESGGQLIADGRIPTQALIAALGDDREEEV